MGKGRYYLLFLVLVVLISYGQTLGMHVWQDDNALFFKLAHINEGVGYFGSGPFGAGVYKYGATPFILIYKLFGFQTQAYFGFLLVLYILTTFTVYKTFSLILGKVGGRVAGFLYAAGYVASDGFFRMANSATTSISIVLVSLFFAAYWKFYKNRGIIWYFAALFFFFLASELAISRTHYLFAIAVAFELIFLALRRPIKSVFYFARNKLVYFARNKLVSSVVRLIPFFLIFHFRVIAGETRAAGAKDFLLAALQGKFDTYNGFLSSLANLVIPGWITKNLVQQQTFTVALGGMLLLAGLVGFLVLRKKKKLYLLLSFWVLVNIAAYSAYQPTVVYGTIDRYLAHSFFALAGLMGLLFSAFAKTGGISARMKRTRKNKLVEPDLPASLHKLSICWQAMLSAKLMQAGGREYRGLLRQSRKLRLSRSDKLRLTLGSLFVAFPKSLAGKVIPAIILILGLGNLFNAVAYQKRILQKRSIPARQFFEQLRVFVPKVNKGDVFYFDISGGAQSYFRDAISAAMMPNTTSIAWRYGVDRYDLYMPENFMELLSLMKNEEITLDKIYSFYYDSNGKLVDTIDLTRKALSGKVQEVAADPKSINFRFSSPIQAYIKISSVIDRSALEYSDSFGNELESYLSYLESRKRYYQTARATSSSEWRYQEVRNIIDDDIDTTWMGSRTYWHDNNMEEVTIDLGQRQVIGATKMTFASKLRVPTDYTYQCSPDGVAWVDLGSYSIRPETELGVIVDKFNPTGCRFIKLTVKATQIEDAPQLAELEVIVAKFTNLDFSKAEKVQKAPFMLLSSPKDLLLLERYLSRNGIDAKACFYTDKYDIEPYCQIFKLMPNFTRTYTLIVPPNGTTMKSLEILAPHGIKTDIKGLSILPLSYLELEKRNYIQDFVEN